MPPARKADELQSVPDRRHLKHTIGWRLTGFSISGGEGAGTVGNELGLLTVARESRGETGGLLALFSM